MAAPKRTAAALRELAGTNRADRQAPAPGVEFDVIPLLPEPPVWMSNKWAVHEWHRLGPMLLRFGLLTQGNITAFAQMCAVHGDLATTYQKKRSPVASKVAMYRNLVSEFGLTPASASKVRAPDPAQKGNAFRNNGKPPT